MEKFVRQTLLYDFYGELLTEKQREALELYYNDDLSLGEIGADFGISRQGVRDNIKRAEAILFEMEEKLGLAEKFSRIKTSLDSIRTQVDIIDQKNIKFYRSKDINESIKVILSELDALDKLNE